MAIESLDEGPAIPDSLPFRRYVALIGAPKCGTTSLASWLNCSIEKVYNFVGVPPFTLERFPSKNASSPPRPRFPNVIRRNPLLRRLRTTMVGKALERGAAYALTTRGRARMDLRDADARFLAEQLSDDIQACVADPQIPTDDWWSPALLFGREALRHGSRTRSWRLDG